MIRNLGAGVASSAGVAFISLAVVPVYIRLLGIEAYGLIGFFATLQALFQMLDLGLAPTVNREVALATTLGSWERARTLLHSFSVVYWSVAAGIALLTHACAPLIATGWLSSSQFSDSTLAQAVAMMGIVIACRWPVALYQSTLIGTQRVVTHSLISLGMAAVAAVGALLILTFISKSIVAFFVWQAAAGIVYALVAREFAWKALGRAGNIRFSLSALKSVWRFSAGMVALTVAGLVFGQLDKVILSKLLGLAEFGQYVLAGVVAGALGTVITPFYNAVFPRFAAYAAVGDMHASRQLYDGATRLIATLLFTIAMILILFSEDLIAAWTGNPTLAHRVAPIVSLLVAGTALHGTMYVPHAMLLARGNVGIPIAVNVILLMIVVPIIATLTVRFGPEGGALAWLILHVLYVLIATTLTHRYVVPQWSGMSWLLREIGIPLAISMAVGVVGYEIVSAFAWNGASRGGWALSLIVVNIALVASMSPETLGLRRSSRALVSATTEESL